MADWGPVVIAVVLFVLLSPGLLFQLPAKGRVVEFGNMQTSGISIFVHTIIFFGLITIFVIAISVHINTGQQLRPVSTCVYLYYFPVCFTFRSDHVSCIAFFFVFVFFFQLQNHLTRATSGVSLHDSMCFSEQYLIGFILF